MSSGDYAEHVRSVVDQAPQLSPEQRDRLSLLLRSARAEGGEAA